MCEKTLKKTIINELKRRRLLMKILMKYSDIIDCNSIIEIWQWWPVTMKTEYDINDIGEMKWLLLVVCVKIELVMKW